MSQLDEVPDPNVPVQQLSAEEKEGGSVLMLDMFYLMCVMYVVHTKREKHQRRCSILPSSPQTIADKGGLFPLLHCPFMYKVFGVASWSR
jgi:hypothetical protein